MIPVRPPVWAWALAALMTAAASVSAQTAKRFTLDRWIVDDGLPNNDLAALAQSADGYLWVGTWAGAMRFDGVRFTVVADDLPNDHTRALLPDSDGSVWISVSGHGLVRWRPSGFESFTPEQGLSGRDVRFLTRDRDGRIWVNTENGLDVIENAKILHPPAPSSAITFVGRGHDGRVLLATAAEACVADGLRLQCERPAGLTSAITALLSDASGALWIGTSAGVFTKGVMVLPGGVSTMLESADGAIWIGLVNGEIARINGIAIERYGIADGLPGTGGITALYEDRERSLWIATSNGGLSRLKPKRVTVYSQADGLGDAVMGSIVQDSNGAIWAATACAGVHQLEENRFVPRLRNYTDGACPRELLPARDGALWIGARGGGVLRWDGSRMQQWRLGSGLSDDFVSALFQDREGRIWIGTETGGVHIYENHVMSRAFREADGVATHHLSTFAQDRDGRVWIGSNGNGLSVFENGSFRILKPEESPPTKNIAGLLLDSRGDLWIGSAADGLFRMRNGKYEPFGLAQGLGDRLVAVMIEDLDANIWVGTARGISRLQRDRIEALASGEVSDLAPIILDRSDGMLNVEGSGGGFDPSGLRDARGRLWFSTIDGIVVVDPASFPINRLVPPVRVEEARLDDAQRAPGSDNSIAVPAGTAAIELSYTAFSMLAPAKVRFRYRLVGFDDEWHDVGTRRTAYYSRLGPGTYTFEVMASNNDGLWNTTPASVRLVVAPFFWERGWVQLSGLAILLLATGFGAQALAQRRHRRRLAELEREQALTRERTRIARDLHDDLGARLAQIALIAEDQGGASRKGIAVVAREAMQTMDELVWTVNARNDTVESFAGYVAEFVEEHLTIAGIRYRLQIQPNLEGELPADTRRHMFLAFKEAVHNVVKHAAATEVRVSLTLEDGVLRLEVSDNGRGLPEKEKSGLGNGMRNMRERMETAGGALQVVEPPQGGTAIIFSLPMQLAGAHVHGLSGGRPH